MRAYQRQEGESAKAFSCFEIYRDLGSERSLAKAAELFYGKDTGNLRQVEEWSSKYDWVDRALHFDTWHTMLERSAVEHYLQERAEDMGRREAALREQAIEARELALEQTLKMLRWPLVTQKTVELDESGTPVTLLFAPAGWSKATAATLYRLAMEGEPPEEDSDDLIDVSRWSEAELHQYVQLMRTAMDAERDTERDTERRQGPGAGT